MTKWYVVHTQPNAEMKASAHLRRQSYEIYVPLCRRWRRHARKRELVLRPLFPRYIFVRFDTRSERWRPILSTVGVSGLICNGDKPVSVPDDIIDDIRAAERRGSFDDSRAVARLNPGDRVRIVRGPFADLAGQLQLLISADRIKVLLDILGRQVPTVLDLSEAVPG